MTPISQQKITHIAAGHNSLINVSITLLSKFTCKAEYKTKEHLIILMGDNGGLMFSPLQEHLKVKFSEKVKS